MNEDVVCYCGPDDRQGEQILGIGELRALLTRIQSDLCDKNILVRLVNQSNGELMIGIGREVGLTTHTSASGKAVHNALGDIAFVERLSTMVFYWGGHWFEMGPDNLLPLGTVRRIAERWFLDGTLDPTVTWQFAGG